MHPTPEQLAALDRFRLRQGRKWKALLRFAWGSGIYPGGADSGYLQQLRNLLGPEWLNAYRPGDTRVGWLKPDHHEDSGASKHYQLNAWRILDLDNQDLLQPWANSKNAARIFCRDHHITLIES